jgi:hypothetical protein
MAKKKAQPDTEKSAGVQKYLKIIADYDAEFEKWTKRTSKIIKKYRDDTRTDRNEQAKFNILWSNVQTLIPAVYAKLPKADVMRRFGDNDQIGRVASLLIERSIDFEIEHYPDFRATMRNAVEDRFLGGRGVAWARYEPHVRAQETGEPEDGVQVTEDADEAPRQVQEEAAEIAPEVGALEPEPIDPTAGETEPAEEIDYECAPVDYVHWRDFGHNVARTWEEVTVVWRWVYMTEDALIERFGKEKAKTISLNEAPEQLSGDKKNIQDKNRAKVCELWDKETGEAYWLTKNSQDFIDTRPDPLQLEGFFPCPKPLYATTTSDSLVPVPDFCLYQDQSAELDILSDRIDGLVKALRVRGVYDATQGALQRLLTEGDNNTLIPVDKWGALTEKGGLKGSIDLLPIDVFANALLTCYKAREDIKAQIYEITGISDIIRGQTAASETATAQQIKGQYAGLRLRSMQEDVALFATGLIRLKAQIICTKFQPDTILKYSAADQLTQADQQAVPQAMALLKDNPLRSFRIEVAADSLVQIDEQQMKQERMEFITAFGGFLEKAVPAAQATPALAPVMLELLKFGTAAFKQARQIEGQLDTMLQQLTQAASQPKPPPKPTPEEIAAQADAAKMQAQAQKDAASSQLEQARLNLEQQKAQAENSLEQQRIDLEREKIVANIEIERNRVTAANDLELAKLSITLQHEAHMKALDRDAQIEAAKARPVVAAKEPVAA